jgi:hypothetical protein
MRIASAYVVYATDPRMPRRPKPAPAGFPGRGTRLRRGPLPPRLGRLYATGRVEQARVALAAAIDLYRAMDMTFWLPQAEAALAQVSACDNTPAE